MSSDHYFETYVKPQCEYHNRSYKAAQGIYGLTKGLSSKIQRLDTHDDYEVEVRSEARARSDIDRYLYTNTYEPPAKIYGFNMTLEMLINQGVKVERYEPDE